jgi:hypothetical protein
MRTIVFVSIALLAACGGSSSSGSSGAPLTGDLGFQAVALSGYQGFRGQADFPYAALQMALPVTSPFLKTSSRARLAGSGSAPAFVDELGLYVTQTVGVSSTSLNFFVDAAGTVPAGSLVLNSATLGNYAAYPVSVSGTVNITAGRLPCTGSLTISVLDATGHNELQGKINLPATNVAATFDFTLDDSGNVGGSSTITEHGSTIALTGIKGQLDGDSIAGNVVVQPSGWSGTGSFSLVTGEFTVTLQTDVGSSQAATNADGSLSMVFGDGTRETVSEPLTIQPDAPLESSDAGPGGTVGGATDIPFLRISAKSSDGRFGGTIPDAKGNAVPAYVAPGASAATLLNTAGNPSGAVYGINAHGAIVGTVSTNSSSFNFDQPAYWSSPSAAPAILQLFPGDVAAIAIGINDSGQIIAAGYKTASLFHHHFIYYSSPTAAPVNLSAAGVTFASSDFLTDEGFPMGINNRGEIIGEHFYDRGGTSGFQFDCFVWSTPTADPVKLAVPAGDVQCQAAALNDSGVIVGTTSPDYNGQTLHPAVWASSGAQPSILSGFDGQPFVSAADINASGAIVGCSGPAHESETVRPGFLEEGAEGEIILTPSAAGAASQVATATECQPFITDTGLIANGEVILRP